MDLIQRGQVTSLLELIMRYLQKHEEIPAESLRYCPKRPRSSLHLQYLNQAETQEIIAQFETKPNCNLVFWSGISREIAQKWADDRGMLTLTTIMGPLMDPTSPRCPRAWKTRKKWSRYVKGAAILFARYACTTDIVRVLTLPPPKRESLRPNSTFLTLEEPILRGEAGNHGALQIRYIHPTVKGAEDFEYELWPIDHSCDWLQMCEREMWECAHGQNPYPLSHGVADSWHISAEARKTTLRALVSDMFLSLKMVFWKLSGDPTSGAKVTGLRPRARLSESPIGQHEMTFNTKIECIMDVGLSNIDARRSPPRAEDEDEAKQNRRMRQSLELRRKKGQPKVALGKETKVVKEKCKKAGKKTKSEMVQEDTPTQKNKKNQRKSQKNNAATIQQEDPKKKKRKRKEKEKKRKKNDQISEHD